MSIIVPTNGLRFERRAYTVSVSDAPSDPMLVVYGKKYETRDETRYRFVLQQAWREQGSGEVHWRDVPTVDAPAATTDAKGR